MNLSYVNNIKQDALSHQKNRKKKKLAIYFVPSVQSVILYALSDFNWTNFRFEWNIRLVGSIHTFWMRTRKWRKISYVVLFAFIHFDNSETSGIFRHLWKPGGSLTVPRKCIQCRHSLSGGQQSRHYLFVRIHRVYRSTLFLQRITLEKPRWSE